MAVSLKHSKVSSVPDGADSSLVRPSDWNAEHVLTQDSGKLLGRTTAGTGATEEIGPSSELTLTAGTLGIAGTLSGKAISGNLSVTGDVTFSGTSATKLQTGTTAERPGTPTQGMFRFNSTTNEFEGYDGTAWGSVGGSSVSTSDTAPTSPADGDLWWDSVNGQLYIYYDDGTSSQWVVANSYAGSTAYLPLSGGTVTGAVAFPAGSASTPSVIPAGDTNTGIFFPAADTIAFTEGGVEAMRINNAGQVMIGTTVNSVLDNVGSARPLVVQSASSATTPGSSTNAITIVNSDTTTNNVSQINFAAITGASANQYTAAWIAAVYGPRTNGQYPTGELAFATSTSLNNAPSEKMRITASGNLQFNSGYGSVATAYGCRAWVNFNGQANPITIGGSGNVSSITDIGAGQYTVNFSTALTDANYAVTYGMGDISGVGDEHALISITSSSAFTIRTSLSGDSWADANPVCCAVFR